MKTKITLIATAAFLIAFSGAFAQDSEGLRSNSDYIAKRSLDLQKKAENPISNKENEDNDGSSDISSKLLASNMINYQAVARDAAGDLIKNTAVTVDFDIHEGTAAGALVYSEVQNPTTDDNGVFSVQMGSVTPLTINWSANRHFLEVSLNGTSVGTTEFVSVPYAKSADAMPADATIGTNLDDANVLTISGSGSELVDIRGTEASLAANDVLNLEMFAGSSVDAQFIEARLDGAVAFQVNGDGRMLINATTTTPEPKTVYGNSMPIAFGRVDGTITTDYGITSVTNPSTGVYLITLDNSAASENDLVPMIVPYTLTGAGEMTGFNPISANSFEVKIFNENGIAKNSAFSIVVFANR